MPASANVCICAGGPGSITFTRKAGGLPLRHDIFGLANFTGLFAAPILLALLVTSNDASLRKLGLPGWKSLQRWNYVCFGLTVCHTFGYIVGIESLEAAAIITATLCVAITAGLQGAGRRRHG